MVLTLLNPKYAISIKSTGCPYNFHLLEVVDRVSETQLQVGENVVP